MGNISKNRFATSALWKLMEILITKGSSTVISIILARILIPEDYGVVALTAVFINFAGILVSSGLETALVRKKDIDDEDYSNAFFFSFSVATIIYLLFFFLAPYLARFYEEPLITPVLRVQMLSLFIGAFSIIRNAIVTRRFQFKFLFIVNGIATIVGGVTGIVLAYWGYGVWALVLYTLVRDIISTLILLRLVKWRLIFKISFSRMRGLISYSVWVLLATFTDFFGNNIYNMVYGKVFSIADLGYYGKGNQFPELVGLQSFGAINAVLLPTLAEEQDDKPRVKHIMKKTVKMSTYVIWPMMVGMAVTGDKIIRLLLTEKWLPALPIMWAACIYYSLNPLRSINMQYIYASGKSRLGLIIELCRCALLAINLFVGIVLFRLNIYQVTFTTQIVAIIVVLLTQYWICKEVHYSYKEWFADLLPNVLLIFVTGVSTYLIGMLEFNYIVVLALQIVCGITVYVFLSWIFKIDSFWDIKSFIFYRK